MRRFAIACSCALAACAARSLEHPPTSVTSPTQRDGGTIVTPAQTDGAVQPTSCELHNVTTLVTNMGEGSNSIAVDGDSVYFANAGTISAVPAQGGAVQTVTMAPTNGVTAFEHHLVFGLYDGQNDGSQDFFPVDDYDLSMGSSQSYSIVGSTFTLAANASYVLVAAGDDGNVVDRIDRQTGAIKQLIKLGAAVDPDDAPQVLSEFSFVGSHAFFIDNMMTIHRFELSSGAADSLMLENATALGSDGASVFVGTSDQFNVYDEDLSALAPVPHVSGSPQVIRVDAQNIYWLNEVNDGALHITARTGGLDCTVPIDTVGLGTLAQDEGGVYVAFSPDGGPGPFSLVRVDK